MNTSKKRVLIVEDDEHISKVYEIKFAKEGIETFTARDGEAALAEIKTQKPDLVILDLMLPKKDGFWVLEEVRKDKELSTMPVLVLSNLGQKTDQDRALGLGANEYLIKVDYSIQDIVEKVKGFLKI